MRRRHPRSALPGRLTVCDLLSCHGMVPKKRSRRYVDHPGKSPLPQERSPRPVGGRRVPGASRRRARADRAGMAWHYQENQQHEQPTQEVSCTEMRRRTRRRFGPVLLARRRGGRQSIHERSSQEFRRRGEGCALKRSRKIVVLGNEARRLVRVKVPRRATRGFLNEHSSDFLEARASVSQRVAQRLEQRFGTCLPSGSAFARRPAADITLDLVERAGPERTPGRARACLADHGEKS